MSNPHTLLQPKSLLGALALWLFLGTIGIHRFYRHRRRPPATLILGPLAWAATPFILGFLLLVPILAWWLVDLFLAAGGVREHNAAIDRG